MFLSLNDIEDAITIYIAKLQQINKCCNDIFSQATSDDFKDTFVLELGDLCEINDAVEKVLKSFKDKGYID